MTKKFNITALFGGIGGMELGLHRHGHRTTLFCENDAEATSVLVKWFPDVPINFDVRNTDRLAAEIQRGSNLLTAGFPCTNLSQAGRMEGLDGSQSGLVRKVFDLIDVRPFEHVLIENVPNWRVLHGGTHMTEVMQAFEARGYRWAYRVVDARAFGLPQRRLRIFFYATQKGDPRNILFHGNAKPKDHVYGLKEAAHGFYWTEGNTGLGWGEDCIPTLKGGSAVGIPAPPAIVLMDGTIVTPNLRDGERLQGFRSGWTDLDTTSQYSGSRAFNQRKRWQLIGNAVNVRASSWLGENLANPKPWRGDDGELLPDGAKWPTAAWFDGKVRRSVELGTWPVCRSSVPLAGFLKHEGRLLSWRASNGFYQRIIKSSLRIKDEFRLAVAKHVSRMEKLDRNIRIAAE
jgi:DNA (cytosine-5)-methyltransferase 1